MEQHRFPRRSASHGTLRSGYSSHGGPAPGPLPFRPLHKPLRSVNENSVLLHSPGALESMLKTTTETGDIGIFTIRPVPPSPLIPRDTISEIGRPHSKPHRTVDILHRQNQAMRPPSHRDTTSEVFSVYGTDSLKSGTSNLSPNSTEDAGQRSYSMTTCGSRHLSHHRSTNTLQSQASGGSQLQRPRSPFPYPTRLKRPGVRPASPAVTESGQIDYSRMVEIDRISYVGTRPFVQRAIANFHRQRTVHSHFKQVCSPMARVPHPLGLRADVNRSTPSLAPPGPPPNFRGPPRPSSIRTHSPASMASWNPPYHERLDSTSTRTSSLTSVTNMYRRAPPTFRTGQSYPTRPPPRYYDYTEDFEDKDTRLTPLAETFAPLRPQLGRYPRSTMFRDDDDHLATRHLAAVFGEEDSAFFNCESQIVGEQELLPVLTAIPSRSQSRAESLAGSNSRRPESVKSQNDTVELNASENCHRNARSSDIDLLPSQIGRESIDTFNPSLDLESRDLPPSYKCVTYHANTTPKTQKKSPARQVHVLGGRAPTIRSEQGVILRDDTQYEKIDRRTPDSYHLHAEPGADGLMSLSPLAGPLEDRSNSNYDNQATAEAFVSEEPQATQLSPNRAGILVPKVALASQESGGLTCASKVDAVTGSEETPEEECFIKTENNGLETGYPKQFRRHRRNHAALRISTTGLPREDNEGHPHITPTCSTVPLVSPKPISPARQLKVKNSIPRLMKALPPLPSALGYDLSSSTTDFVDEEEFADILVPFSFAGTGELLQIEPPQPPNPMHVMRNRVTLNPQRDTPKFKLRIKTSSSSEALNPFNYGGQSSAINGHPHRGRLSDAGTNDEPTDKFGRNFDGQKLKVRSPRRRSGLGSSEYSTVRRNPRVGTSRVVTEIMRGKPQDLFGGPFKSETILFHKHRKPLSSLVYSQAVATFNSPNSTSPERRPDSISYRVPSDTSTSSKELPAIGRDKLISSIRSRGLAKRLSNLRVLLSSSTPSTRRVRGPDSWRTRKITTNVSGSSDGDMTKSVTTTESMGTEDSPLRFTRRTRARLYRWFRGARTAIRKCARVKHNHKGTGRGEDSMTHV
ncbi:hypothetical protein NPX13_g4778 [Xylaria arbuscula]|uniref:Uncharacterized protein n=1 Tax=Xylaria arbuscula TaxID=114810 RepID=A0A9W8NFQ8_9PEZI|nr:hypothetical protein NPX13_g4778 [Xylaria arbuscula]